MLGNHDLVRFGDLIQRGNLGDYTKRHKAALSFLAAYSGPITIYYGDEIGDEITGFAKQIIQNCAIQGLCDDHVSRSSAKIEGVTVLALAPEQQEIKQYLTELMRLRSQHPALYAGKRRNLWLDDNIYADLKVYGDEKILYVLNTSTSDQILLLDTRYLKATYCLRDLIDDELFTITEGTVRVGIPALSGRFLMLE